MFNKEMIRTLAESERMMDRGETPFVWMMTFNGQYERMAVAPAIMEELELEQGQTINSIIQNAIFELSLRILAEKLDDLARKAEDSLLDENFDFRKEMNDDNNN